MRQLRLTSESQAKEDNHNHELDSDGSPRHRKVTARWNPANACRPQIDEAPVFCPTIEEFEDTLSYIAKIRPEAEQYGICRIVPPASWVPPPCPLKDKDSWQTSAFPTRIQQIDLLQNRKPMMKTSETKKRKRRSLLPSTTGKGSKRIAKSSSKANVASEPDEEFGFPPGSDFTLKDFEQYANFFKQTYFGLNDGNEDGEVGANDHQRKWEPSVEEVEGEYWRIVEQPTHEVKVYYGADLDIAAPKPSSLTMTNSDRYPLPLSSWNLRNFALLPGSALYYQGSNISGVHIPWMYIGMCFSTFCWHVEDHHLYSINYLHWGDPKVWYGVPGSHASALEDAMRMYLPDLFEEQPNLLKELVTLLSPSILKFHGGPVYRTVQHAGEFVITFPRAYHCGFNGGFNCAEAVNLAPVDWFEHGQKAVELYSLQCRKTSLSHDKLLFASAEEAVHALAAQAHNGNESLKYLQWISASGKDGVLTNAIKTRITMEKERLGCLPSHLKMLRMREHFAERECFSCFYDLHLSAVVCKCSPDRYSCLRHSNLLCPCGVKKRFLLFRYTMDELSTLVEALEGEPQAIAAWANRNTGNDSVNAEDAFDYEHDYKIGMLQIRSYNEAKGSIYGAGSNIKSNSNYASSSNSQLCRELDHSEFHNEKSGAPENVLVHVADSDNMEPEIDGNNARMVERDVETSHLTNQSLLMQKFGISLEPTMIRLGFIMHGRKQWCNNHAIYPRGFKSHVKFFSFTNPSQICDYVCEISDAGFRGPLFKVSIINEEHPRLAITSTSVDMCWKIILDKLCKKIERRATYERGLPALDFLKGICGHQMFGFLSPSIVKAIEAEDPSHSCIEYWSEKDAVSNALLEMN